MDELLELVEHENDLPYPNDLNEFDEIEDHHFWDRQARLAERMGCEY
jgi:hypothetical protein